MKIKVNTFLKSIIFDYTRSIQNLKTKNKALIKKYHNSCYKQKTTTHINSTFNRLRSSFHSEAMDIIQRWWQHSWNSFLGIAISCLDSIPWIYFLDILKILYQVRFNIWRRKKMHKGRYLENMEVVESRDCFHCLKTSTLAMITNRTTVVS